jgi:IS1 family transposase
MASMNRLSTEARAKVVSVLVEGNSLRATARITGVARMTIEKLLRDLGAACERFHNERVRDLKATRVQCDEIWAFVGAKEKNATPEQKAQGWGDAWTWTGMDADSKLMISWLVGGRGQSFANAFMSDVAARLTNRVQLTTDGNAVYLIAVDRTFGVDVDYGQLQKLYTGQGGGRYSPAKFIGAKRSVVTGDPDQQYISTSYVERQNLTMRMHMRRFTRLTNGFSKKLEMHALSVALHFTYYNWCKVHQSLRVTPAMEAGLSDHVWSMEELVGLAEHQEQQSQIA